MPGEMHFKRDWDFSQGNKPIMLNDLTNDSDTRDAILALLGIIIGNGDALNIEFSPTGTISATNVQAAIEELDADTSVKVANAVNALVSGAPGVLDTLDELAAALGDDANFATTITAQLATKVSKTLVDAKGDLLVGTANDTLARLPATTDGYVLTLDSAQVNGMKWAASAGGSGGSGGSGGGGSSLLGYKQSTNATQLQYAVGSPATMQAVDTTNLSLTVTVPSSGVIEWTASAVAYTDTNFWGCFGLLDGAGAEIAGSRQKISYNANYARKYFQFYESGLTPGATITRSLGMWCEYGTTIKIEYGGNAGPVVFSAHDASLSSGGSSGGSGGGGGATPAKVSRLRKTTDQTISTGVDTKIVWEAVDTDGAGTATLATSEFTAQVSGLHQLNVVVTVNSGEFYLVVYKNGVIWKGDQVGATTPLLLSRASASDYQSGTVSMDLVAGDTVELYAQAVTSAVTIRGTVHPCWAELVTYGSGGGNGAPAQRVLLSDTTLSAAAASIDVPSISQNYDDLEVVVDGKTVTGLSQVMLKINNDGTSGNYSRQAGGFTGTSASAGTGSDGWVGSLTTIDGTLSFVLSDYRSSRTKVVSGRSDVIGNLYVSGFRWNSTAAINRLTLTPSSDTFAAGTRVRVYGLKDVTEAQAASGGGDSGGDASWHNVGSTGEPAFQNSWHNFGGTYSSAAFRKDANGFVHVKGTVIGGANNTVIFTLPVGYRPAAREIFPCSSSGQYSQVQIAADGTVNANTIPGGDSDMAGIVFYAEG